MADEEIPLLDPVALFCEALTQIQDGSALAYHCMFITGGGLEDVEVSELDSHLRSLIDDVGLHPEFLIMGLWDHLVRFYREISDPTAMSAKIDEHLRTIENVTAELAAPPAERRTSLTDEQLAAQLANFKELASNLKQNRETAEPIYNTLLAIRDKVFVRDLWTRFSFEQYRVSRQ